MTASLSSEKRRVLLADTGGKYVNYRVEHKE